MHEMECRHSSSEGTRAIDNTEAHADASSFVLEMVVLMYGLIKRGEEWTGDTRPTATPYPCLVMEY